MLDVGAEIMGLPMRVVGFGRQAGEFAPHIGESGELFELGEPWIEEAVPDSGFSSVIENEGDFRAAADQFENISHLVMVDADVEREPVFGEAFDSLDENGFEAEAWIGFLLKQASNAFDKGLPRQLVEFGAYGDTAFNRGMSDDAPDTGFAGGEVRDPIDLQDVLGLGTACFDKDQARDG